MNIECIMSIDLWILMNGQIMFKSTSYNLVSLKRFSFHWYLCNFSLYWKFWGGTTNIIAFFIGFCVFLHCFQLLIRLLMIMTVVFCIPSYSSCCFRWKPKKLNSSNPVVWDKVEIWEWQEVRWMLDMEEDNMGTLNNQVRFSAEEAIVFTIMS